MNQQARRAQLFLRAPRRHRYILAGVLVPLVLILLATGLSREFARAEDLRQAGALSHERRAAGVMLLSFLKDAETAQRGYILSRDPTFLAPYAPARARIDRLLAQPEALPDPNTRRIAALRTLVATKFAELDETIALVRAGEPDRAIAHVATGEGKRVMDRLRALIGDAIRREGTIQARNEAAFDRRHRRQNVAVTVALVLLVALLMAVLAVVWRLQSQRYAGLIDTFDAAERHRTILDSTIDAILILNPSGTIEVVNAAATAMLGYGSAELERRDVDTIIDLAPGSGSFHRRIGLTGGLLRRSFLTDRSVRHRDGRTIAVDVAMGVMHLPSGDHIVVSLRDIAERKRIERVKDDLISTVSHELRTPLTSVVGSLGLLKQGGIAVLPPAAQQLIDIAENNSRRLIRLINDMLDIDRIESGKLDMARGPVDLVGVIDEACLGSQGLARGRGVDLHCHPMPRPVMVTGDGDRLLQVLTNLISNAVHASPHGATVELTLAVDADGHVTVAVDDRGPGIPPAFRDRIFGRFERAHPGDGAAGTGLGLAIAREIMVRHDGRIWFEDREGGGTRFAVSLATIGAVARGDGAAARVLICHAGGPSATALVALVLDEGCTYDVARSVQDARAALARRAYAALIVDPDLPGGDGAALAGDPAVAPPVIVAASAGPDDDMADAAAALRDVLAKTGVRRPVVLHVDDDADLLAVVAAALWPAVETVSATTLPAARAQLRAKSPDAVILDIQLADGSGLDLLPCLINARGRRIPTIVYSAQETGPDIAGRVDAVLVKARGTLPDLKATIRRVLRPGADADIPSDAPGSTEPVS